MLFSTDASPADPSPIGRLVTALTSAVQNLDYDAYLQKIGQSMLNWQYLTGQIASSETVHNLDNDTLQTFIKQGLFNLRNSTGQTSSSANSSPPNPSPTILSATALTSIVDQYLDNDTLLKFIKQGVRNLQNATGQNSSSTNSSLADPSPTVPSAMASASVVNQYLDDAALKEFIEQSQINLQNELGKM